jgi:signal transduction histidine kinase
MIERQELWSRLGWFIRLRWIAATAVVVSTYVADELLRIVPRPGSLYLIGALIALYNAAYFFAYRRFARRLASAKPARAFANLQISADLVCLAALMHFSGGIENPFMFYFVFHIMLSSILLSRKDTFIQATLAVCLVVPLGILEALRIVPHHHLRSLGAQDQHSRLQYLLPFLGAFTSTIWLVAYMATSVAARLWEREEELRRTSVRLQQLDQLKSEYILRVTHRLRSPLSTIESCLRVITEGLVNERERSEVLEQASERTEVLLSTVNDLLELSRVSAFKEDRAVERVELCEVLEASVMAVRPKASGARISLSTAIAKHLPPLVSKREILEELFGNLLENAVRYTPPGGRITVGARKDGQGVHVVVRDTGIGIPQDDLPRIFDEFYRARNAVDHALYGSGLGLYIAKEIVDVHGGRIWVESEEGRGSTFHIVLHSVARE